MSTAARKTHLTPEQYLAIERLAETKSEYYRGEMFAMSGASLEHTWIVANLVRHVGNALAGGPCRVSSTDLRVLVRGTGLYTYPDVVVLCGKPELLDGHFDTLLNPSVLFEVLSPSTANYDRGKKFAQYRTIESLQEYVVIEQERMLVERHSRREGAWELTELREPSDHLRLDSIGASVPLSAIYEAIEFPPPAATPTPR